MLSPEAIDESLLDSFHALAGSERISHKRDAALARRNRKLVFNVIPKAGGILVPVAREPLLTGFGIGEGVRRLIEKPIVAFAPQQHETQEAQEQAEVGEDECAPTRLRTARPEVRGKNQQEPDARTGQEEV